MVIEVLFSEESSLAIVTLILAYSFVSFLVTFQTSCWRGEGNSCNMVTGRAANMHSILLFSLAKLCMCEGENECFLRNLIKLK